MPSSLKLCSKAALNSASDFGNRRTLCCTSWTRAPKGTPENIIKFYEDAFKKTMEDPEVIAAHEKAGMQIDFKDSKSLAELIKEQYDFCKNVVSKLYEK